VNEAAVTAARAGTTRCGLDERDLQRRLTLLERKCSPEPGEAAADDADVRLRVTRQMRSSGFGTRFVQPPRWQTRRDAQAVVADRCRRIWMRTLVSIAITAIAKIAVPMTFTCGGAPFLAEPQT
jgi:hypothetical protein